MAIKSPQKFTSQEIEEIKNLQIKFSQITMQLGQVSINKIKLKEQENNLNSELLNLEKREKKLANNFTKKYGKGSLDIETGEFTPTV